MHSQAHPEPPASRTVLTVGFCAFLVIAAYFLWTEHRAHVIGILPWLALLACPLIHLLMHRDHGGHAGDGSGDRESRGGGIGLTGRPGDGQGGER